MPWALMIPRVTAITVMANTELATRSPLGIVLVVEQFG